MLQNVAVRYGMLCFVTVLYGTLRCDRHVELRNVEARYGTLRYVV